MTALVVAGRPSRFRPARDGVAVTAYLVGQCLMRWALAVSMVVMALLRPFTPERLRVRHRELHQFAAPFRGNFSAYMTAVGAFALARTADTWRRWLSDPRARALRLVGVASLVAPVLLALLGLRRLFQVLRSDPITTVVRRVYSQQRLATTLPNRGGLAAHHQR